MRKYFFILSVVIALGLGNLVFADVDVGAVSVEYCNKGIVRHAKFLVKDGVANELCLEVINKSDEKLIMDYRFYDGVLSNNGEKACSNEIKNFGQFVSFPKYRQELLPNSTITLTGILQFPVGYGGDVAACLAYSLAKKKTSNAMIDVLVRKIGFLDGRVVSKFERKEMLLGSTFGYYLDRKHKRLDLSFPVLNLGDSIVDVLVSGSISNILGYERKFLISGSLIALSGQTILVASIPDIPFYKGIYRVDSQVTFVPAVSKYDISNFPKDLTDPFVFIVSKNIILIPWGGVIVFVFLILGFAYWRKYFRRKK